ncbi:MAG TPA: di-heme oxidoredictase family protein [Fibrobacteria bacterium]|nr:di-heme oxidoredictase family protein [Fibrobacteria bacterium]
MKICRLSLLMKPVAILLPLLAFSTAPAQAERDPASSPPIGQEKAIARHLQNGEETNLPVPALIDFGKRLFEARWTIQEGGGRPLTKGTGSPLSDPSDPLRFPRNFNRVSAPDANSCAGCHNLPFGLSGGGGEFVTNAFVPAQRFDFATFDHADLIPTKGAINELREFVLLHDISNSRSTLGLFGSGFIEMLSRQMTMELQAIRNSIAPGKSKPLAAKGVSFGILARDAEGRWLTDRVEGLPFQSLTTSGPSDPPKLVIQPFHQSGTVVSIRQFTNNAFNHHHGMQSEERFGSGQDPDGDDVRRELTRADVTAASLFQAALAVPGRVIPNHPAVEKAIWTGEKKFEAIGCARCHIPALPLTEQGWIFSEPNPFNPPDNLQPGQAPEVRMDLTSRLLPPPRLAVERGAVQVPAYTDLKLHDITSGPDDPNADPVDMNRPADSPEFLAGNTKFLTKKLWGAGNEPPFFHHGKFMTLRQAVLAHSGEALPERTRFQNLGSREQDALVEFLKSLQVLPPGTRHLVVDENGKKKKWPPT